MGKFIEVADVLGLGSERLWFHISGFNGYEISSDGYVRSMKHYKKYPTGILIRPKSKDGQTFELSNDFNERVSITKQELWDIAMKEQYKYPGYPRRTYQCDMAPRNIKAFIPPKPKVIESRSIMPQFTVIKEERTISYECPIYDLLERSSYYGR